MTVTTSTKIIACTERHRFADMSLLWTLRRLASYFDWRFRFDDLDLEWSINESELMKDLDW